LAARWTAAKTGKLIFDVAVTPHWLDEGDRFWYGFETNQGRRFYLVDPVRKTRTLLFEPTRMAAMLTTATGIPYDGQHLPFKTLKFVNKDKAIQFALEVPQDSVIPGEKKPAPAKGSAPAKPTRTLTYELDLASSRLTLLDEAPAKKPLWASLAPDDQTVIFARSHNLFMMDAANYAKALKKADDPTIVETRLSTDGEEDFSYARTRNQGGERDLQQLGEAEQEPDKDKNARMPAAGLSWSQDSKKVALVREDQRKVGKLWVINALATPRPTLETYPYAMPGEAEAPQAHLEIFDLATKARVTVAGKAFQDQSLQIQSVRATAHAREHDKQELRWTNPGSNQLYFVRLSRDMHRLDVCVADTATGTVKPLIQERMNVYIEYKPLKVTSGGQDLVWWSERDGWGHYYLYGQDGTLRNPITQGDYVATDALFIDEKARTLTFTASGREGAEDPYYSHVYRVGLDGSGQKLLDPADATHATQMGDSGRYFVDTYSRVDTAPKSVLRDALGAVVLPLETVDLTAAFAAGFKFPEPFKVKADDGITDLYGVMYKPFDFDPSRTYPIIEYVYPGPQTEAVTKAFTPKIHNVMLANFGFIVIEVGNRGGNPSRSKWYHTFGYGNLRDYGLADKKGAIEQLAARHPFIDSSKVGIWGHSGGGFMTAAALMIYPDFFKVGWSESGNHENNIYNNVWSEKHQGVKEIPAEDKQATFDYQIGKNTEIARNLKGHLMLVTGDIDNNVHPGNTFRLADALIRANKRFEMMVLPGQRHGYVSAADYVVWARADFFCRHLLGASERSIDMAELNREKQQAEKASPAAAARVQQQRATAGKEAVKATKLEVVTTGKK
jgi:dipeptidyl aminopeptidase/acylaminoacyl peptidase